MVKVTMNHSKSHDDFFKLENIENTWQAVSLQVLLSKAKVEQEKITRAKFFSFYARSIEYAWILCHAALKGENNLDITEKGSGDFVLTLTEEQIEKIKQKDAIDIRSYKVIPLVLAEIFWHFFSNDISDYCITLLGKDTGSASSGLHVSGETDNDECRFHIIIKSADFVRFHIDSFQNSNDKNWVGRFDRAFGWSTDGVKWGSGSNNDVNPPSFLTFGEFTDNMDGIVWRTDNKRECIDELAGFDFSDKFKKSVDVYMKNKQELCLEQHDSLSICCGVRYSHGSEGDDLTPYIGDELLGVFVTLNLLKISSDILKNIAKSIYFSSGSIKYILLQNLAREKAYLQQKDQRKLKKQAQMLKLLKEPLDTLTEALSQTQQDTQILRSVLYDPHKVLFSVASQVEKYFSKGEACSYGRVQWKGMHTINGVTSQNGGRSAGLMLAAIICRIFGKRPEDVNNQEELYTEASESLMSEDSVYSDLKRTLVSLVPDGDLSTVVDQLKVHLVDKPDVTDRVDAITSLLERLKTVVFTPFKFSGTAPLLPLALILSDHEYKGQLNLNGKYVHLEKVFHSSYYRVRIFPEDASVILRYSNILSLISGVLGYMQERGIETESINITTKNDGNSVIYGLLVIVFDDDLFDLKKMPETFRLMKEASEKHLRMAQGNFRKPFIDFASSVQAKEINIPDNEKIKRVGGTKNHSAKNVRWQVFQSDSSMELCVESNKFILQIEKN